MTPGKPEYHPKSWGHETWIANDKHRGHCTKILHIAKGKSASWHFHRTKHEVMWVQRGRVEITVGLIGDRSDAVTHTLAEGELIELNPGVIHQLRALEDTDIVESSTYHEESDVVRVEPAPQ
jgi:mannose-6-phosphate isomerase-like protein (cupin superfamily)